MLVAPHRTRHDRTGTSGWCSVRQRVHSRHMDAMTPEVVQSGKLATIGSDCRSLTMVILSLVVQLLVGSDARASDVNGVRLSLKQIITGACRTDCSVFTSASESA